MKDNKKVIISSMLGIIALCIITLSLTYAYWQINKNQTGENVVNTDCFNIEFEGKNDILLNKAYPMKDEELEEFIGSATPYTFTITNKCSSLASATINMEILPISEKKLSDEWIDVLLYDAVENKPSSYLNESKKLTGNLDNTENKVIETSEKAYALHSFTLKANEEKKFNLLIYMNQDTPAEEENMNATWKGKITLSADYKVDQFANAGTLRAIEHDTYNSTDEKGMWGYRYYLTKIVIENKLIPKTGNIVYGPFDESVDGSNNVQSYVVCEEEYNCIGYLQGNGKIKLNEDSSYLFDNFYGVTTIEGIDNLDTSNVTDMSYMFAAMDSLQELNLGSNFDTSNVTDMSDMFASMESLQELNLGDKFDTSRVTNMQGMFNICGLQSLDLSKYKFDTTNVTDMSYMFAAMDSLQELNLGSSFNTSNVKNMSNMFGTMSALKSLDLSKCNFNTDKVTDMSSMFWQDYDLEELNLGDKFDTSNVKDMSFMFWETRTIQELNLGSKFNTSSVTDMHGMFCDMRALQTLDLSTSNFDTSNVDSMQGMFGGDSNLTTINYGSNFIHKSGASTVGMFGGKFDTYSENYVECPASKPDASVHSSWSGVSFDGVE